MAKGHWPLASECLEWQFDKIIYEIRIKANHAFP